MKWKNLSNTVSILNKEIESKLNTEKNKRFFLSFVAMWWWIIWHLYWDWGHIVGEFPYPDTSLWTDAELGIPPDDDE